MSDIANAGISNPTVVVQGTASVDVEPDLADLHINAQAFGKDRAEVMATLQRRAAEVRAVIDGLGEAVTQRYNDDLSVHASYDNHKGQRVSGYGGSLSTRVTIHDFDVISDFVLALYAVDGTEFHGPYWRLSPDHPVFREARLASINDGMRRAHDYAAAFGAEITGLLNVSDSGTSGGAQPYAQVGGTKRTAMSAAAESAPEFEFDTERQRVDGSVQLTFVMSTPTLQVGADGGK